MRPFTAILEKGKKYFEDRDFNRRLTLVTRAFCIPAIVILAFCLYRFYWPAFLPAAILPLIALPLVVRIRWAFAMPVVARTIDLDFRLRDLLTTANEFQSQENDSPVLRELMEEADRRSKIIEYPGKPRRDQIERAILISLFILLLIWNLLPKKSGSSIPDFLINELGKQVSDLNTNSDDKNSLKSKLNDMKNGKTDEDKQQAAQEMQQQMNKIDFSKELQKLGAAMERNSQTREFGKNLSDGKTSEAGKSVSNMVQQLSKDLSKEQEKDLRNNIQDAMKNLNSEQLQDLKKALDDMQKSMGNQKEMEKAGEKLSQALKEIAKQQETIKKIQENLEQIKKQAGQGQQDKKGTKTGQKGGTKPSPEGKPGEKPGEKKDGNTPGTENAADKNSSGKDPWKKAQKNTDNSMGKGGKTAGGKLTEDPKELLKKGKADPIKGGKKMFDGQKDNQTATTAQLLSDFEKGALLNDQDKIRLKIEQEAMAKSREVDEFSRKHRVPPSFKTFLKDFFVPNSGK